MKKILAALVLGLTLVTGSAYAQDTCMTPAQVQSSITTNPDITLTHTYSDPAEIAKLRQAIADVSNTTVDKIIPFDSIEVYASTKEATQVLMVIYNKGCEVSVFPLDINIWNATLKGAGLNQ